MAKKKSIDAEQTFSEQLEVEKRQSTLQLLFKVARLVDEEAVRRTAKRKGVPQLRRSHMSLFPHIDLSGTRITELAERMGISKQAVSQLVEELEQMGVLARVADPDDARARRVQFTERGRKGLLEGLALLGELECELACIVGERRIEQLHAALLAIHDNAQAWQHKE